jgi:hypothetical protein
MELLDNIPYRIDLAGGWLDQPYISSLYPGSVITLCLEPIIEYKERCGMATSTRRSLKEIWNTLPNIDPIKTAEILFRYDNRPGKSIVSGAQDSIGLCVPGLSRHSYNGKYWPNTIERCINTEVIDWLEKHIFLFLSYPRPDNTDIITSLKLDYDNVVKLSESSDKCWNAIMQMDLKSFADEVNMTDHLQKQLFPAMGIDISLPYNFGHKFAGAGGGGYIILIAENKPEGSMDIKIKRCNG